jgi:hypothetical protein
VASAAPDEHKESDLEACDSESDVDGDVEACDSDVDGVLETCDSDVDGDRDLSESQDADSDPNLSDSEDADDCLPHVSHAWTFPKAHAMCHATTTIRLFGPLEGSSGESLEKRHVAIKDSFQRTNNKPGSELQVLCSEMRKDDTWSRGANGGRSNEGACAEVPAHAGRARTNASFQDNVHFSGKRFPVWEVARRWRKCSRMLKYAACRSHVLTSGGNRSKVKVAIPMRSLYDRGSEWRQNCADVKHLPAELARYIRDTYSEYWVAGQFPKIGGQALSWQQIVDLCAKVQPCQRGISQGFCQSHGCTETHLEVFNALEIVCPGVPGEVNCKCWCTSTSICYRACIMCFKHAYDSP